MSIYLVETFILIRTSCMAKEYIFYLDNITENGATLKIRHGCIGTLIFTQKILVCISVEMS